MTDLISRVADHCFWFGRYLERAETSARALALTHTIALGAEAALRQSWLPVIIVAGEEERFATQIGFEYAEHGDAVQSYMTWHPDNPSSIHASVKWLRENARAIRDQISLETWVSINELHLWMLDPASRRTFEHDRYEFYRRVWQVTQQVHGLLSGTMLHDTPLDFILLGVYLERASQTARILDVHHHANTRALAQAAGLQAQVQHAVADVAVWISFLRTLGAYESYMKRHRGHVSETGVTRFLVTEPDFPRSIAHSVYAAHERLARIRPPHRGGELPGERSAAHLGELREWVRRLDRSALEQDVHGVLTRVVDEVHGICSEIGSEFLGAG